MEIVFWMRCQIKFNKSWLQCELKMYIQKHRKLNFDESTFKINISIDIYRIIIFPG